MARPTLTNPKMWPLAQVQDRGRDKAELDQIAEALKEGGSYQRFREDRSSYSEAKERLAELPAGDAAAVLAKLNGADIQSAVQDLYDNNPSWVVAVVEAMPDNRARELLSSMASRVRDTMQQSRKLRHLLQDDSVEPAAGRHDLLGSRQQPPSRQATSTPDPERIAARAIKSLNPERAEAALDLLGTRKAVNDGRNLTLWRRPRNRASLRGQYSADGDKSPCHQTELMIGPDALVARAAGGHHRAMHSSAAKRAPPLPGEVTLSVNVTYLVWARPTERDLCSGVVPGLANTGPFRIRPVLDLANIWCPYS